MFELGPSLVRWLVTGTVGFNARVSVQCERMFELLSMANGMRSKSSCLLINTCERELGLDNHATPKICGLVGGRFTVPEWLHT